MKHILFMAATVFVTLSAAAQNVQLHYDLGRALYGNLNDRMRLTTTVEMFRPDAWGSTFFFIDIDYHRDGVKGAYWEIAREVDIDGVKDDNGAKRNRWAAHVEYNGGVASDKGGTVATRFQDAVMAGPAWNWHCADWRKTFSVQAMYRYTFKGRQPWQRPYSGFQLTEVWGVAFARGLCSFAGFCDLWYDPTVNGSLILVSEPQFWVNLNAVKGWERVNLSLGTEVEVSNNFVFNDAGRNNRFYAIPTLAAKWTF